MPWTKHGLVYHLDGSRDWRNSHTQLPVVDTSDPSRWRIYYSSRDRDNRSHACYFEVSPGDPRALLREHNEPLLALGARGHFDEHGIMPTAVIDQDGRKLLYYIGWSRRVSVPYQNAIGLAVSDDGGASFRKYAAGPLLGQNAVDPLFTGTLAALRIGETWHAYYMSATEWCDDGAGLDPRYHLRHAVSADAVDWRREGRVVIDYRDHTEGGIVGASVLALGGGYRMWYACRGRGDFRTGGARSYRIGYAESDDGVAWHRRDEAAGIDVSDSGWDSEMICYPCVVRHGDSLFMFYNGNGFGRSGIGFATRDVYER